MLDFVGLYMVMIGGRVLNLVDVLFVGLGIYFVFLEKLIFLKEVFCNYNWYIFVLIFRVFEVFLDRLYVLRLLSCCWRVWIGKFDFWIDIVL